VASSAAFSAAALLVCRIRRGACGSPSSRWLAICASRAAGFPILSVLLVSWGNIVADTLRMSGLALPWLPWRSWLPWPMLFRAGSACASCVVDDIVASSATVAAECADGSACPTATQLLAWSNSSPKILCVAGRNLLLLFFVIFVCAAAPAKTAAATVRERERAAASCEPGGVHRWGATAN
jgi:hypothetical protein